MERYRPVILFVFACIFSGVVGATAYYKSNGIQDLNKVNQAIADVQSEIAVTQEENDRYRREIDSLNHSNSYVESIARENLGLVKPGEVVYEFIDAKELTGAEANNTQ